MKRQLDLRSNESGQATLEVILLLIITVIIILSLLYQFNQSFKNYAQAFFDGYIACLLETGELPGSGGICKESFAAFNPNDGSMLLKDKMPEGQGGNWGGQGGGNWGGQGGGNWGGQGGGNWNGQGGGNWGGQGGGNWGSSSASGAGKSGQSPPTESVSGNAKPGEGTRGGAYGVGRVNSRFGRTSSTSVGDTSDPKVASSLGGADSLLGRSPTSPAGAVERGSLRRGSIAMGWGYYGDEQEKEQSTSRPFVATVTKKSDGGEGLRPRKAVENLKRGPAQSKKPDTGGFSFGEIVKFLFIAAIIIAIVIFFGGQVLQISKSGEK